MNKKKLLVCVGLAVGEVLLCLSFSSPSYAETHVANVSIDHDTVWDQPGSPYILEGVVNIPIGLTLTVKPGVSIQSVPSLDPDEAAEIDVVGGRLLFEGDSRSRISVKGLRGIYISKGYADVANTDITGNGGLSFKNSAGHIASSTISGTSQAVGIKDSKVEIWGSRFSENRDGIRVEAHRPVLVEAPWRLPNTGGIGNALEVDPLATTSSVHIWNSVIADNTNSAIANYDTSTVMAADNWWGSTLGPQSSGVNKVLGPIEAAPWLMNPPLVDVTPPVQCCSSVLFIPGLEGSRLYKQEKLLGVTTENQLWEPNRNTDVKKLFLDPNGSSTDKSIYAGGAIDKALGLVDVYGSFMKSLDSLIKEGSIAEWNVFGYDWRQPISEVVAGRQKRATTTESLVEKVTQLASRSKTGKVTVVAHSNGGLVAKSLVQTLVGMGKADLIDSVISVAVPYLGTPQAITALLYGTDQALGYGLVLKQSVARQLGLNMPSAYSLLPSREYFSKILTPTIAFASTTMKEINNGSYPRRIDSYDSQMAFLNDSANLRQQPATSDTDKPIEANKVLSVAADIIHATLDPFVWPATIAHWAILGWNAATASSVKFVSTSTQARTETTPMGDGTVVAPSAAFGAKDVVTVDLQAVSKIDKTNISHANILRASTTQAAVQDMIRRDPDLAQKLMALPGVTLGEPDYSRDEGTLVVSTHSPVELHVYDSEGRHVGLKPLPAGLDVDPDLYVFFDQEIPGSKFILMGDPENAETQINLPDDTNEKYTIVIRGVGVGEFRYEVLHQFNQETIDTVEYTDMPVTPLMVATTSLVADPVLRTGKTLTASIPTLDIDVDGDGSADIKAKANTVLNPTEYLESIRKTIFSLMGQTKRTEALSKRIAHLQDLSRKGKMKRLDQATARLDVRIRHLRAKGLSQADKTTITDMLEAFIAQLE